MNTKWNLLLIIALLTMLVGTNTSPVKAEGGGAITIGPDELAIAEYETAYSQQFTTSGGTEPYTFSTSSTLPTGITLSSAGLLAGFPSGSIPGTYPISVQVSDANSVTASRDYNLALDKGTPTITGGSQPNIYWNSSFNIWAEVRKGSSGLIGTVAFFIDEAPVPGCEAVSDSAGYYPCSGVSMDLSVGTHTVRATYTPTDGYADYYASGSVEYEISVQPSYYNIHGSFFDDGNQNLAMDADEDRLWYWKVNLDQGCDGTVDQTADVYGDYSFYNIPGGECYRITPVIQRGWVQTTPPLEDFWLSENTFGKYFGFYHATITLGPDSLPDGNVGQEYSQTLSASGGTEPYTYAIQEGDLPAGLSLSSTGVLSGTPTAAGSFHFVVAVDDANNGYAWHDFSLRIITDGVFVLDSSANPSAAGEAVIFSLSASGDAVHFSAGPIPPAGLVTFFADGTAIEGCKDLTLNVGDSGLGDYPAACTTGALEAGSHEITAAYSDYTGFYNGASLTLTQVVAQPSSYTISGSLFLDMDRDGVRDEGESTLYSSGPVYLNRGCDGTEEDYVTSVADGGYAFSGLPGGECYRIRISIEEAGLKQYTQLEDFTLSGDAQKDIGFHYPPISIEPPPGSESIPTELPSGSVDEAYYQEFTLSGGEAPYGYEIIVNYLPEGLTLTQSEDSRVLVLSGTTSVGGVYGFEVDIRDATNAPLSDADGNPAFANYVLVIKTDGDFTFTSSANPSAPGEAVTFTVSATGEAVLLSMGPKPPVGRVTLSADGTPIEGCQDLNLNLGASGIGDYPATCTTDALEVGSHAITAAYTDLIEAQLGLSPYNLPTLALTQQVGATLSIAPDTLPHAVLHVAYSQQLTASGGAEPYAFSLMSGTLPDGYTLSSAGVLAGNPYWPTPGSYPITVQVQDGDGNTASRDYTFVLEKATPTISAWASYSILWGLPFDIGAQAVDTGGILVGGTADFSIDGEPVEACQDVPYADAQFVCKGVDLPLAVGDHTVTAALAPTYPGYYNPATSEDTTFSVQAGSYYIMGAVFRDDDPDGQWNSDSEPLLPNWTVELKTCDDQPLVGTDGNVIGPQSTGYQGWFTFQNVPGAQCVRVSEVVQPGWQLTTAAYVDFTLKDNVHPATYELYFGNRYPQITIGPSTLADGNVGEAHPSVTFEASGGQAPYTYTMMGHSPDGLALSLEGTLSGTPTKAGLYSFSVQAEDANQAVGTRSTMMKVRGDGTFSLTSSANPAAPGEAVTFTLTGSGQAYHFYAGTVRLYGRVTFQADGADIAGCKDLGLNSLTGDSPATCTTSALAPGMHQITAIYTDEAGYFHDATLALTQVVTAPEAPYQSAGFAAPIDLGNVLNSAKAGQMIPLKWRLLDSYGNPVTNLDPASVTINISPYTCPSGTPVDSIETYANGTSSLQNLGDGYYQLNWKTDKAWSNLCKKLTLKIGDWTGDGLTPLFWFKK